MPFRNSVRWSCTPTQHTTPRSAAEHLADLRWGGDRLQAAERFDPRVVVADRRVGAHGRRRTGRRGRRGTGSRRSRGPDRRAVRGPTPRVQRPGSPCTDPTATLTPSKSTQPPFHSPYASSGRGGGSTRSTRHASAPPPSFESVMQFVLPDGVVNATSSPSCVVTPSRVATWYSAASAVPPASIQAMTSATGALGAGGWAGAVVVVGGVVVAELRVVLGGIGVIRSASPSVVCEHPATRNKIAISPAIRIPPG